MRVPALSSVVVAFSLLALPSFPAEDDEPETLRIGSRAPDFDLPGVDGGNHRLADFGGSQVLVVVFTCNHCPTAQAYEARIKKLANLDCLHYQDYCPQGPSSRYSGLQEWGYTRRIDPDSKAVSYGDLMKPADCPDSAVAYLEALSTDATEEGELYFFLPYASGSDYSGSTVEKANCREFLESYGEESFVWEAHGGYDTYAVVLGLTGLLECAVDTFDAILDIIEGLEDYLLIDDEALSNVEMEGADEAWESWVAGDFRRALEKKFDGVDFEWPSDSDLRPFFEADVRWLSHYGFRPLDLPSLAGGLSS